MSYQLMQERINTRLIRFNKYKGGVVTDDAVEEVMGLLEIFFHYSFRIKKKTTEIKARRSKT